MPLLPYITNCKKTPSADITELSVKINKIVNDYLEVPQRVAEDMKHYGKRFDISKINFELLGRELLKQNINI